MKNILLSFVAILFTGLAAQAQAPQLFNYQGVARSTTGTPIASSPIGLQLKIHDGSAGGTVVYAETQTPATNTFGLYNVSIGGGTVVTGTLSAVNWASGPKYIEVGIDPAGGASYTSAGTAQLLSVPYAIYSNISGTAIDEFAGIGTANVIPKYTGPAAMGNSMLFDNGTTVGLNTTTPSSMTKFHVSGIGTYGTAPYYQAGIVADGGAAVLDASGIYSEGGWRGVFGRNPGTATGVEAVGVYGKCEGSAYVSNGFGVKGEAVGTGPTNYGVYGNASGGTLNNYGVYGTNSGVGYAGYFSGNVHITGTLSKGSGTFMIDHPLDPENKYLYHSFVESPDMMNIYNGNIVTDANGDATVNLPDYFDALNKDFRYQLTVMGTFAQAIVAEKVSNNHFKIKTDKPNVEVSWMVTGVRQDKFANAHRVVPEVQKEQQYKGYYLHAAEWGMPDSKSIDALTRPAQQMGNNVKTN